MQARLDLWLKAHIEKLLGPLFALSTAEDITGIARGIAFQLIEALGVLERAPRRRGGEGRSIRPRARRCASTACALAPITSICRTCSSPAPRALAAQLWALKEATPDTKGPRRGAASGLLRPHVVQGRQGCAEGALSHRGLPRVRRARGARRHSGAARGPDPPGARVAAGSPAPKPAGAVEGGGFTVTVNMTSLTGTSGEDFASILRSLGYRMDRKPKPPEPVAAAPAGRAAALRLRP